MAIVVLQDLPPRGALLGLDPGTKTIGVAACDPSRIIASPLVVIQRGKKLAPSLDRLFTLYDARQCVGLVMGLPVQSNLGLPSARRLSHRGRLGELCLG